LNGRDYVRTKNSLYRNQILLFLGDQGNQGLQGPVGPQGPQGKQVSKNNLRP